MCKAYTSHKAFFVLFGIRDSVSLRRPLIFLAHNGLEYGVAVLACDPRMYSETSGSTIAPARERERSAATDMRCGRRPQALFGALPVEVIFAGSLFSARCCTAIVSVCKIVADRPRAVNDMSSKVSRVV